MKLEDRLSSCLQDKLYLIKRKAEPLLEKIEEVFPEYTIHDIRHSNKVIEILDWFVPDELKEGMKEWEVFFLLCASVLHDCGMARFSESEKIDKSEVRRIHHLRSEEYVETHWMSLGFDDEHQAKIVGRLCRGHRENPENKESYDPRRIYENAHVNMPLLAMFLRIADALDLNFKRAPWEYYEKFSSLLGSISKQEWERHRHTSGVNRAPEGISRIEVHVEDASLRIQRAYELLEEEIQKMLDELPDFLFYYSKYGKSILTRIVVNIKPTRVTTIRKGLPVLFEVKNKRRLAELETKGDFLENPLSGKFLDPLGKKELDWQTLKKKVIDFSWVRFPKKEKPYFTICFVTGRYGSGKTTYLYCWLDECLSSKRCWFKSIVFLNPTREIWNEEEIMKELENYDFNNVIVAIDSLYRETDDDNAFMKKFRFILDKIIRNGFRVIITLRDTHFGLLQKRFPFDFHAAHEELKPTEKSTKSLLENYLSLYNVDIDSSGFEEACSLLHKKSEEGLPYYIHHFVRMLSLEGRKFSKQAVEKIPLGMMNLIWYTIDRELLVKGNETIPLILRILLGQRKSLHLSLDFFEYFSEWYVKKSRKEILNKVPSKISLLKMYLAPKVFRLSGGGKIERYQLDQIWKESLEFGLREPEKLATPFESLEHFRKVSGFYDAVKQDFTIHAKRYLSEILENSPSYREIPLSAVLLADLAKFNSTELSYCSKLFLKSKDRTQWSDVHLNYIKNELALAWFVSAIDLRDEGKYEKAIACLEEAIKIREFKQALHFYAHLLERKLPQVKREESEEIAKKIEEIWKKLVNIEEKDYITWQRRAIFYKNIGEFRKAEECFEIAYNMHARARAHVPTLQAFAIFCGEMGNRLWNTERQKAQEYFNKAYRLFEQGKKIAEKTRFSERELLNAFANFLTDLAAKDWRSHEEKIELDRKTDDIWKEVIKKYQNSWDMNSFAKFLMKAGWRLSERYPGGRFGKNIDLAEEILRNLAKSPHNNPISQHILARLLYKCKLYRYWNYEEKERLFKEAEDLLNESAENSNVFRLKNPELHKASCYHELGRFYMEWADEVKEEHEKRRNLVRLAKANLNKAENTPENNSTYHHLSGVYRSISIFHARFYRNWRAAQRYAEKTVEFSRKAEWTSKTLSAYLINMGDEIFRQEPKIALYFYEKAAEKEKENFRLYLVIGQCRSKLAETENFEDNLSIAIDDYCKAAEIQKTKKRYRLVRSIIQRDVKKKLGPWNGSLWKKCLESMKFCSENIIEKGRYRDYWEDYINYSGDLMDLGRWSSYESIERANRFFKESLRILNMMKETSQRKELVEGQAKISDLEETCHKWSEKLEISKGKTVSIHEILKLDITTCEKFGNIERAKGILKEYFDLLFPLKILDSKKLYEMGEKFSKWKEFEYTRWCLGEFVRRGFASSESLEKLAGVNMKLGRFEEAVRICQKMILNGEEGKMKVAHANELLRKCESALETIGKISEGFILLTEVGKAAQKSTRQELAGRFYRTGKRLAQIKKELDLKPIISSVATKYVSIADSNTAAAAVNVLKAIMIPRKIIRSCLWRAKEQGLSLSREDEQTLSDFKAQSVKAYLYVAQKLKEEAENAQDVVGQAKYIKAAFYYLYFLALKSRELQHKKEELSDAWGRTGGSLVGINNNSLIKISSIALLECFQQSVKYDERNYRSWSQLGWQLLHVGELNKAETAFNKSKEGNRYSFAGLGEIAERRNEKIKARYYHMKTVEIVKQSEIGEREIRDLRNTANKLINLGYMIDALEICEIIENLLIGRKKLLMRARIQILKDQL